MIFSVQVTGVLNSNKAFDSRFFVPADTDEDAVKMLETEFDWSDAKSLTMAARVADEQDIPLAAHHSIVRT